MANSTSLLNRHVHPCSFIIETVSGSNFTANDFKEGATSHGIFSDGMKMSQVPTDPSLLCARGDGDNLENIRGLQVDDTLFAGKSFPNKGLTTVKDELVRFNGIDMKCANESSSSIKVRAWRHNAFHKE